MCFNNYTSFLEEDSEEKKSLKKWTEKADIRKAGFLAVGKACEA